MAKKGQPSAPTPVDPNVVSQAQSKANIDTAGAQQKLNMVNTTGPDGSVNYVADPNSPGGYTQQTTLSPGQQGLYDQSLALQGGALNTAGQALAGAQGALGQPLTAPNLVTQPNFNKSVSDAVYQRAASRLNPQWGLMEDRLRNRLSNQGFSGNSTGYDNQMRQFGRDRNDAYALALNDAEVQGENYGIQSGQFTNAALGQDFANRGTAQNMPINQLTGLLSLGQVSNPQGINYTPSQVAPTDVTGAYALNAQQQQNAYNAKMQNYGSGLTGLFNLGSAAVMATNPLAGLFGKKGP